MAWTTKSTGNLIKDRVIHNKRHPLVNLKVEKLADEESVTTG